MAAAAPVTTVMKVKLSEAALRYENENGGTTGGGSNENENENEKPET